MHFLITAAGTREYIDPVRFISNASSGKMGYALARAALSEGHKVTLISGPTRLRPPDDAKVLDIETTNEMFEAVKKHFNKCDYLIMAAAVSDYTPAKKQEHKIKKNKKVMSLKLKPTVDILKWAAGHKKSKTKKAKTRQKNIKVVGFALEDRNIRKNAEKKMKKKNLDMIVANTPKAIGREKTTVYIKTPQSDWLEIKNTTKTTIAKRIVALLAN